jgi:hypothetical protein
MASSSSNRHFREEFEYHVRFPERIKIEITLLLILKSEAFSKRNSLKMFKV